MPRPVSATFRAATWGGDETAEVFLPILRFHHPSIVGGPLRFVNDTHDLVSNGETYIGCPFQMNLPDDRDGVLPEVQLAIDNVDRQLVATVRSITTPPEVEMELVLASTPNVVEVPEQRYTLRAATWDVNTVTGTLKFEDVLNERFPGGTFTARWPGLH